MMSKVFRLSAFPEFRDAKLLVTVENHPSRISMSRKVISYVANAPSEHRSEIFSVTANGGLVL